MMELAGRIVTDTSQNVFERDSWIRIINDRPELIPAKPLEGIPNPFEPGEMMTVYPDPAYASLVVNGEEIGTFDWAMNDEMLLNVHGKLSDVGSYAKDIAKLLGGRFVSQQ